VAEEAGDAVQQDEPLFEISTDKVDAEIPSPAAGTLSEIKVQAGTTVQINTVVAVISVGGAAVVAPAAPRRQHPSRAAGRRRSSPGGRQRNR
jgi:pyruvate dehydrogenase E2 component (dihydrolipoamide acetyltransferase)